MGCKNIFCGPYVVQAWFEPSLRLWHCSWIGVVLLLEVQKTLTTTTSHFLVRMIKVGM